MPMGGVRVVFCLRYACAANGPLAVEVAFTAVYLVEMSLKHVAWGCGYYWSSVVNAYDGIITLASSLVQMCVMRMLMW